MTIGAPIITCLHRFRRIHKVRVRIRVRRPRPRPPNTESPYRKSHNNGLFKEPIMGPLKSQMADPPSWILTPKRKNAIFSKTKQFRAMVSIDDLWEVM